MPKRTKKRRNRRKKSSHLMLFTAQGVVCHLSTVSSLRKLTSNSAKSGYYQITQICFKRFMEMLLMRRPPPKTEKKLKKERKAKRAKRKRRSQNPRKK